MKNLIKVMVLSAVILSLNSAFCFAGEEVNKNNDAAVEVKNDIPDEVKEYYKQQKEAYDKIIADRQKALDEYRNQQEESKRQQEQVKKQLETQLKLQEEAVKQAERAESMQERLEKQLDKTEEQQRRYDAILSLWENQQKQYQQYLDSLNDKNQIKNQDTLDNPL